MEEFRIFDKLYPISKERQNFNELKKLTSKLGFKAAKEFEQEYLQYKSFEEMTKGVSDLAYKKIYDAAEVCVQYLIDHDIFDVNCSSLVEDSISESEVDQRLSELVNWIEEFNMTAEEKERHRQLRKAGRGRVVGGGFGLSGAIKGMLTAGAINAATGAAHSVFNMIGKGIQSIGDRAKLTEKLEDQEMINGLMNAVLHDICALREGMMNAMKRSGDYAFEIVTADDSNRAEILYDNLTNRQIPEEKKRDLIFQMLQLNPYNRNYYVLAMSKFPDESANIGKLAKYFNIDFEKYYDDQIWQSYTQLNIVDEDSAIKAKEFVLAKMEEYGVTECRALTGVNRVIERFHEQECTYLGYKYNSKETCEKARADDAVLTDECRDIEHKSRSQVLIALSKVNQPGIAQPIAEKHRPRIIACLEALDRNTLEEFMKRNSVSTVTDPDVLSSIAESLELLEILPKFKEEGRKRIQRRITGVEDKSSSEDAIKLYRELDLSNTVKLFRQIDQIMKICPASKKNDYQKSYETLSNPNLMQLICTYKEKIDIAPYTYGILLLVCFIAMVTLNIYDDIFTYDASGLRALTSFVYTIAALGSLVGIVVSILVDKHWRLITFNKTVYPGDLKWLADSETKGQFERFGKIMPVCILVGIALMIIFLLFITAFISMAMSV